MAAMEQLTKEASRVIAAPYAVSLKSLYDIAKTLRTEELNVWARAKSCQLSPLAARICQSYTRWPFGLDLLTQLCQTVHFRNAMLRVEPSIIHDILSRASEDEEVGNQHQRLAIALLSFPLPNPTGLPAVFVDFLKPLVENMSDHPSTPRLRGVYRILHSIGPSAFELLPDHILQTLGDECLSCVQTINDNLGFTISLAICANFAKLSMDASSPSTSASTSSSRPCLREQQWFKAITQVFNSLFVAKTLDLIVMRVILFCSNSNQLSKNETLEGIALARQTLEPIGHDFMLRYVDQNEQKMKKLQSKIRGHRDLDIQIEALSFVVSLTGWSRLSAQCHNILADAQVMLLLHAASPSVFEGYVTYRISRETQSAQINAPDSPVSLILAYLIDTCRPAQQTTIKSAYSLERAISVTDSLITISEDSHEVRTAVLKFIQVHGLPDWWDIDPEIFRSQDNIGSSCNFRTICERTVDQLRQHLGNDISRMLIYSACCSATGSVQFTDASVINKLVTRLQQAGNVPSSCESLGHISSVSREPEQIGDWAESGQNVSWKWRTLLEHSLLTEASASHQKIVDFVGRLCEGLEQRCETVETPFREAESRYSEANEELRVSRERIQELESALASEKKTVETASVQNSSLHAEIEAARSQLRDLQDQVKGLVETVQHTKSQCQKTVSDTRQEAAADIMKYETDMVVIRAELSQELKTSSDLSVHLEQTQSHVQRLELALSSAQATWNAEKIHLEQRLADACRTAESDRAQLESMLAEKNNLLQEQRDNMQTDRELATTAAQKLSETHHDERRALREKIQLLRTERNDLRLSLTEAEDLKAKLVALMGTGTNQLKAGRSSPNESEPYTPQTANSDPRLCVSPTKLTPSPQKSGVGENTLQNPSERTARRPMEGRMSLPAPRVSRTPSSRAVLGPVSPNKSLGARTRRQTDTFPRPKLVDPAKSSRVQSVNDHWDMPSFDENDELMTSTDPKRLRREATIVEATEDDTATDL